MAWVAHLINFQKRFPAIAPIIKIDQQGNISLPVPQTPQLPVKEKTKEKDWLARYLDWVDGEAKKLKNLVVLPAMCQIFSQAS
jgi:hypothetical protein